MPFLCGLRHVLSLSIRARAWRGSSDPVFPVVDVNQAGFMQFLWNPDLFFSWPESPGADMVFERKEK